MNVPPTAKGAADVVLSSCELPTYQLTSVAQSLAQYRLSHILKTEVKLRVLGNVPKPGIIAVRVKIESVIVSTELAEEAFRLFGPERKNKVLVKGKECREHSEFIALRMLTQKKRKEKGVSSSFCY